jgi:hypothetical protein
MKEFYVTNIEWDTDGEKIETLPTEAIIEAKDEDEIADKLSDEYGFCIFNLTIKERR